MQTLTQTEEIAPEILARVAAVYTDGGVIRKNPSAIGGTWAFVAVDAEGVALFERSGVVPATATRLITNNHTEQIAIVKALEAMPEGWSGTVCSDSSCALGRVFEGWKQENLPSNIIVRTHNARARLGVIDTILFEGHPTKKCLKTKADNPKLDEKLLEQYGANAVLIDGIGKRRNRPVSKHNVRCDELCGIAGNKYYEEIENQLSNIRHCAACGGDIKGMSCPTCADTHRTEAKNLMDGARANFFENGIRHGADDSLNVA